jgi:hypothetical protein
MKRQCSIWIVHRRRLLRTSRLGTTFEALHRSTRTHPLPKARPTHTRGVDPPPDGVRPGCTRRNSGPSPTVARAVRPVVVSAWATTSPLPPRQVHAPPTARNTRCVVYVETRVSPTSGTIAVHCAQRCAYGHFAFTNHRRHKGLLNFVASISAPPESIAVSRSLFSHRRYRSAALPRRPWLDWAFHQSPAVLAVLSLHEA